MSLRNSFDKVRLFFRKEKEPYLSLYNILGFVPGNISFYKVALMHKSYKPKEKEFGTLNNERLEFLGDAVLGAIVADILYEKYPEEQEGYLSTLRSKLVKRESLNKLAVQMGLDKLVKHSDKMSTTFHCSMYGNAFEAFIGAIYLDKGYGQCYKFVKGRMLTQQVDVNEVAHKEENFKSRLIEWCQKYQLQFEFVVVDEIHIPNQNATRFDTEIVIEGVKCGSGSGYSKKESHQRAARNTMKKLHAEVAFVNDLFERRNHRIESGTDK